MNNVMDGWVNLKVQVVRQAREKAIQVVLEDGQIHWLPRSCIEHASIFRPGMRNVVVTVKKWLAEEEGLANG